MSAELRRAAGLPPLGPGAPDLLTALTVELLGFLAGDPVHGLAGAVGRWEATVASPEEAQADLAAVRATLGARLAGPTPRLHGLVDALVAAEEARFLTGGTSAVDALIPFVAARQPLRAPARTRSRRRTRPSAARRPRPPLLWSVRAGAGAALAAGVAVVAGLFPVVPAPPTALLPNYGRPPAPAGAPPGGGPAAAPGAGTNGADRGARVLASPAAGPGATEVSRPAASPSGSPPGPVQPVVLTAATVPTTVPTAGPTTVPTTVPTKAPVTPPTIGAPTAPAGSGGVHASGVPHPVPKGHADARPGAGHLGHAVVPSPLHLPSGHQKIPPAEQQGTRRPSSVLAEKEPPRLPQ